jgi:hypothetical protein
MRPCPADCRSAHKQKEDAMTPKPDTQQISVSSQSEFPESFRSPPSWWCAAPDRFQALVNTRYTVHRHDTASIKMATSAIGATLISGVSIYSADAFGAMSIPLAPGFLLLFVFFFALGIAMWLLDRRLVQQITDLDLRSRLWLDLLDAIKDGCVDVAMLGTASTTETQVEGLLRKEAAVAARFLASKTNMALHLPILGHCFTLEKT